MVGNWREHVLKKTAVLAIGVVAAIVVTLLLLAVFAMILLKAEWFGNAENIAVICIRVAACFFAGFFCGRKNDTRGFLWGLAAGCLYFLFLILLRLGSGQEITEEPLQFITTFLCCAGSGMLGGMLS